jgi:hypothetical protein
MHGNTNAKNGNSSGMRTEWKLNRQDGRDCRSVIEAQRTAVISHQPLALQP